MRFTAIQCISTSLVFKNLLLSLFALLVLWASSGLLSPAPASAAGGAQPDIVFVLLDDMSYDMLASMDRFRTELQDQGTTFESFFLSTPMCCPSRTNFLLGDFSHNHGVWEVKNSPYGGYHTFKTLGHEEGVVAKALQQDHGYRTALMGKFFNWYPHDGIPCQAPDDPPGCGISSDGWRYVPPYWTTWRGFRAGQPSMFDYFGTDLLACDDCTFGPNGGLVILTAPDVYNTDYLREQAVAFIEDPANAGQPIFLWIAPVAPHKGGTEDRPVPAGRYENAFRTATWPEKPNLFEQDRSDKPTWLQNLAPLDPVVDRPKMDAYFRDALRTLAAVEDMLFGTGPGIIGGATEPGVLDALEAQGRLENAYIFVASDNGYHFGEHGLKDGKRTFFEEDVRVPLIVRGPGVPAGVTRSHLVANVDLARTFLELAGGNATVDLDGRSLVPLLRPAALPTTLWRRAMLLERLWSDGAPPDDSYGIRTEQHKLMTYPGPDEQLYDLAADPFELTSAHDDPGQSDRKSALAAALEKLKTCDGPTCRGREGRDPEGEERRSVAALFDPCITDQTLCTTTIVWDSRHFEKAHLIIRTQFGGTFRCLNAGTVGSAEAGPWSFGPIRLDVYDTDTNCGDAPPEGDRVQSLSIGKGIETSPRPTGQIVALPSPCIPDVNGRCEVSVFVRTANLDPTAYDRVEVRLPSGALWRQWSIDALHHDITGNWQTSADGRELSLYPGKAGQSVCVEAPGPTVTCNPADPATNVGPRLGFADMHRLP